MTNSEQYERWSEQVGSFFAGLRVDSIGDEVLGRGRFTMKQIGAARVFLGGGSRQVLSSPPRPDSRAAFVKLGVMLSGNCVVDQGRRQILVGNGEMVLYDVSKPYTLTMRGPWKCILLMLPRTSLAMASRRLEEMTLEVASSRQGAGRVLTEFLLATAKAEVSVDGESAYLLGAAAEHLLCGAFVEQMGERTSAQTTSEQLREQTYDFVRRNFSEPTLDRSTIARALRISLRTLDRLFADEDVSVAGIIRQSRLAAARLALVDGSKRHRAVAYIAETCGYADPAHFSRAFRHQFDMTPSEFRSRAEGTGATPVVRNARIQSFSP